MSQAIYDKSAKVIVVDSSATNRQMTINLLKGHGFADIRGTANLRDAVELLEAEPIDWIITPLFPDEVENALNLLHACTRFPELHSLQLSLLTEASDAPLLPTAFKKGLFSWHPSPFTKESLSEQVNTLMELVSHYGPKSSLVSAHYIRNYLKRAERPRELLLFEKRLLQQHPEYTSDLLKQYAEACFISGDYVGAETSLSQLEFLYPEQRNSLNAMRLKYPVTGGAYQSGDTQQKINLLGINRCLVVDNDDSIQQGMRELFSELGIEQIETFSDGESAVAHIKEHGAPDLIVHEWRIPKLTGPYFMQRAMSEGALTTPFVVYSALIKDSDIPFLREMGVANVLQKPIDRDRLIQALIWTVQQDRMPSESASIERKIRTLLRAGKLDVAKPLIMKMVKNPKIPLSKKILIRAEAAFLSGDYKKTQELCIESIKHSGDSLLTLNLLGKALMMLRDFPAALKCMRKAQDLSPHNIERLCRIAEAHSAIDEADQAGAALASAKAMDASHKKIQATELDIAIATGDEDKAKHMLGSLDSIKEFISYTNNKAVACARCGFYEEGMEHYRKVLAVLDDSLGEYKSIITYNLAMAYARSGDFDRAKSEADKVIHGQGTMRLQAKAKSLIRRINKAMEDGFERIFDTPNTPSDATEQTITAPQGTSQESPQKATEPTQGHNDGEFEGKFSLHDVLHEAGLRGAYLVFTEAGVEDPRHKQLLETPLRFVPRSAIERDESGGADKVFKAGA